MSANDTFTVAIKAGKYHIEGNKVGDHLPLEKAFPKLDLNQPEPFFFLAFLSAAAWSWPSFSFSEPLAPSAAPPEATWLCWYCNDPCELAEFTDDIESLESCRGNIIAAFFSLSFANVAIPDPLPWSAVVEKIRERHVLLVLNFHDIAPLEHWGKWKRAHSMKLHS